jgi:hypothetical protein
MVARSWYWVLHFCGSAIKSVGPVPPPYDSALKILKFETCLDHQMRSNNCNNILKIWLAF